MFKRNLVARALMRLAALLDQNSVLDAQYKTFIDWCEDYDLERVSKRDYDHAAKYETRSKTVFFECEEFLGDALCIRGGEANEYGKQAICRFKWEFRPEDDSAAIERRLNEFAHKLRLKEALQMPSAEERAKMEEEKRIEEVEKWIEAYCKKVCAAINGIPVVRSASYLYCDPDNPPNASLEVKFNGDDPPWRSKKFNQETYWKVMEKNAQDIKKKITGREVLDVRANAHKDNRIIVTIYFRDF